MHDARPRNRSNFLKMLYQRHAAKCRSVDLVGAAVSRGRQAGRQEGSHHLPPRTVSSTKNTGVARR